MTSQTEKNYLAFLDGFVEEKSLRKFYPKNSEALKKVAAQADKLVKIAHPTFVKHLEIAKFLSILALYDVVLLLDDSGSMKEDEGGRRIKALQTFLTRIADVTSHFDTDGFAIRWLNHYRGMDHINKASQVSGIVDTNPFYGWTMLGTAMQNKVLGPFVLEPAYARALKKPVLVMIITDGEPNQEPKDTLKRAILYAQRVLLECAYPKSTLAVQIALVGNDTEGRDFVQGLDIDSHLGDYIDCIREERIEKVQELPTADADYWLAKLLLGAVYKAYDKMNDSK